MDAIKVIEKSGKKVEIHVDENPQNPRDPDYMDHDSLMCLSHRRYNFPNETIINPKDFLSWVEVKERILKEYDVAEILPVYMYDHSGVSLSTSNENYPFNDKWDSGQIGFIFITKQEARRSHMVKRLSKKVMGRVHSNLVSDVELYGQYLSGEVYGYQVKDESGEVIDSCWGFYGDKAINEEVEGIVANIA